MNSVCTVVATYGRYRSKKFHFYDNIGNRGVLRNPFLSNMYCICEQAYYNLPESTNTNTMDTKTGYQFIKLGGGPQISTANPQIRKFANLNMALRGFANC